VDVEPLTSDGMSRLTLDGVTALSVGGGVLEAAGQSVDVLLSGPAGSAGSRSTLRESAR
jgi:hypothetical protein